MIDYEHTSSYRWVILLLAWLTAISLFSSINQLSPISAMIIKDLGISGALYGILYSSPMLGVACMAIIAGAASDRFGPRIVISLGLSIVGVCAFSRGLAAGMHSYGLMLACNLCMGFGFGMTYPNLPKIIGDWFSVVQRGVATSIYSTGIPCGSSMSLMLTIPVVLVLAGGNWTKVPLLWGYIPITIAILLWIFCRNSPTFVSSKVANKGKLFNREVYQNRTLWKIGSTFFCCTWVFYVCTAWFPKILGGRGVDPVTAGVMTGMIPLFGLLGNLIVPILSDRIHWRSLFIMGGQILGIMACCLMFFCPINWFYVLLPIIGFCDNASYACLAFLLPLDIMPREQRGSATGFIMTMGYVSALLSPVVTGLFWDVTQSTNAIIVSVIVVYTIGISIASRIPDPLRRAYLERKTVQE